MLKEKGPTNGSWRCRIRRIYAQLERFIPALPPMGDSGYVGLPQEFIMLSCLAACREKAAPAKNMPPTRAGAVSKVL